MHETFNTYFYYFLHPFESARKLRGDATDLDLLEWDESLAISWAINILRAIMSLSSFYIGLFVAQKLVDYSVGLSIETTDSLASLLTGKQVLLLFLGIQVIFYPLNFALLFFLFRFFINLSLTLFDKEVGDNRVEQVIMVAMSNQLLKLVPVMGGAFYFLGLFISLFAGLRQNLELSLAQTFFTLLLPFAFLGTFFILFFGMIFFFVASGLSYLMT